MNNIQELTRIVGIENIAESRVDCLAYSRDMSVHSGIPDTVVFVNSQEQIIEILKIASEVNVPVTARGSGSSVTGAALPAKGGIVLDFTKMNRILEVNHVDRYAVVEPGVVCSNLNKRLAPSYFFPPDPGSAPIATLGGMIATNASGIRAAKYGTTRDYLKACTVIMADGRIIKVGDLAPKSSPGYDLKLLFCGSEGTLGIITEAVLGFVPLPEYEIFAVISFTNLSDAGKAVQEILAYNIRPAVCEIIDHNCLEVARRMMHRQIAEQVTCQMYIALDGDPSSVKQQAESIDAICRANKSFETIWSDDPIEKTQLFAIRRTLVPAMSRFRPGHRFFPLVEDIGVPISALADVMSQFQSIGEKYGITIATFGHVGDGNLHPTFVTDPNSQQQWESIRKVTDELISLTLQHGGTFSTEHGIGMARSPYIRQQLGDALDVMQNIKSALDPQNILNPGKMGFSDSITDIFDKSRFIDASSSEMPLHAAPCEIQKHITACIQCGYCRIGCPTFAATSLESLNAKGRITLVDDLIREKLSPSPELTERLYQCTLCNKCKQVCPAQIDVAEVVRHGRRKLVEKAGLPEIFLKKACEASDLENRESEILSSPGQEVETLLFTGCRQSRNDAPVREIFHMLKHPYRILANEDMCCGYLAYQLGDEAQFMHHVTKWRSLELSGVKRIITTCSGCFRTLRNLHPTNESVPSIPVLHYIEFLDQLMSQNSLVFAENGNPIKMTYHDPCNLARHSGITELPRNILKRVPGIELVEMSCNREYANCCGAGGGLKVFDRALTDAIAQKRIDEALETGAEILVTACSTCNEVLQCAAESKALSRRMQVLDLSQFLTSRFTRKKAFA